MVAEGSRVVTVRGLLPIERITIGELVLTHERRFMPVISTTRRVYEGRITRLYNPALPAQPPLIALPESRIRYTSVSWAAAETLNGNFATILGLHRDDWDRLVATAPEARIANARGTIIQTPKGPLVMGIAPDSWLGRIMFAADSWHYQPARFEAGLWAGETYGILTDIDASYVVEGLLTTDAT
jgi:hypothetical protein